MLKNEPNEWELPKKGLRSGEEPKQCAKRDSKEGFDLSLPTSVYEQILMRS